MKYSKEQRLLIGREIYSHELTLAQAAEKYQINPYTARDYMREYRDINHLEPMSDGSEDLQQMSKDELINEVIKARVAEERAKKGYLVKGDGQEKEFITSNNVNLK